MRTALTRTRAEHLRRVSRRQASTQFAAPRTLALICSLALFLALTACGEAESANELSSSFVGLTQIPDIRWSLGSAGGPLRFAPDGATLATGSTQTEVQLLSAVNGALIRTFPSRAIAHAAAFSSDGNLLAVASAASTRNVRLFRVGDGELLFELAGHDGGSTGVEFSPRDPEQFASAGLDRTTKIWSTDGRLIRSMRADLRVLAIAYSPDGAILAANASGTIQLWRVADGALLRTLPGVNPYAVAYSPDGRQLSTGKELYEVATGKLLRRFAWPATGTVTTTAFTKDGAFVIAAGEDFVANEDIATVRYFRASDGTNPITYDHLGSDHAYVSAVAVSSDGRSLAYTLANDFVTTVCASPF